MVATRRDLLERLRDELVGQIENDGECDNENHGGVSAKELPAISRELRMVLAELDALPSAKSSAPADEIAKKRNARRQQAANG